MLDFIRIACAVPEVRVGDTAKNAEDICRYIRTADRENADILLFPELALTGYTCGDLFFQDSLWNGVKAGMEKIVRCGAECPEVTAVVGLPLRMGTSLYNCAAVLRGGRVLGLVPKTFLPNYGAFQEKRWFSPAEDLQETYFDLSALGLEGTTLLDNTQLFTVGDDTVVGVEICEDLWTPLPPSSLLTLAGAEVVLNLSASPECVGKRKSRKELVKQQSAACACVYAYSSAACTESTQDMVFSGHSIIAENGTVLGENETPFDQDYLLIRDCDLGRIRAERRRNKCFAEAARVYAPLTGAPVTARTGGSLRSDGSLYPVDQRPFVPQAQADRLERCLEIFRIQVAGLKQRLAFLNADPVVGVSGGMDSTLALLAAVEAVRELGKPASCVYGVTMPGFGTSSRTYASAAALMEKLGVSRREIDIREAVNGHFRRIGYDPLTRDATFENAQARERTQILMDFAGTVNGIVVGTGDMSELALGWCTYNGDHMSMYHVNATVPKTLMRWMLEAIPEYPPFSGVREAVREVLDTPISPELLPPEEGETQKTEELIGPYVLHDFFLYHMLRFGFTPTKIYALACRAFRGTFDGKTIQKWMRVFYRRFFSQQYKRSCLPEGVKVGLVGLSPRGDWKMPGDITGSLWLAEIETLV